MGKVKGSLIEELGQQQIEQGIVDQPRKGIFETLYGIDVKAHVEKKGSPGNQFDYLKWSVAFRILLQNYPKSSWRVLPQEEIDLGVSKEAIKGFVVGTEVTIVSEDETITRRQTLPVTNYSNQCIPAPDQMAINTAIQRCYVKTIALFGLGMRVYENVTFPEDCADPDVKPDVKPRALAKAAVVGSSPTAVPSARLEKKASPKCISGAQRKELAGHLEDWGVSATRMVQLIKDNGYKTSKEILVEEFEFFKSEVTRIGEESRVEASV